MSALSTQHSALAGFYRLQHPESGLYIRIKCVAVRRREGDPSSAVDGRIVVRLTARERATRFPSHAAAVQCFGRYIGVAPLEIVRSDA